MPSSPTEAANLSLALSWLRPALALVIVVAVPLLLISTNVRWLTENRALYLDGFARHGVSETTRLSPEQLERVADAFIAYFRGPKRTMDVQVELDGQTRPLFNERELVHMEDVQRLVHGFHTVQLASVLALLVATASGFWLLRGAFTHTLAWAALGGAGLTLGLLVLVGILTLVDFQSLFIRFHLISFSNDFWILDPRRDYLIMLFPYGFWLDATLRLAFLTAAQAVAVGLAGFGLLKIQAFLKP